MTTLIRDNTMHKPVSNKNYREETVQLERSLGASFQTHPEIASTMANFEERKRSIASVKPVPSQALIDAGAASFGNRKILEVVLADDDREAVKNVLENPWKKIAALRITTKKG